MKELYIYIYILAKFLSFSLSALLSQNYFSLLFIRIRKPPPAHVISEKSVDSNLRPELINLSLINVEQNSPVRML